MNDGEGVNVFAGTPGQRRVRERCQRERKSFRIYRSKLVNKSDLDPKASIATERPSPTIQWARSKWES